MRSVAIVFGLSVLTAIAGFLLGLMLFGQSPYSDFTIIALLLSCVGGIIGAIAGAAQIIAIALRDKVSAAIPEPPPYPCEDSTTRNG